MKPPAPDSSSGLLPQPQGPQFNHEIPSEAVSKDHLIGTCIHLAPLHLKQHHPQLVDGASLQL